MTVFSSPNFSIPPIPITLITGFLGAGKTTFLNQILQMSHLKNSAVIVNEFGEISIDHFLIEQADLDIITLNNGCLCCHIRGDLLDTLAVFIDQLQTGKIKQLDHIFIETSGLADPLPILQAIMGHPILRHAFKIANVITIIDAQNIQENTNFSETALQQIACADYLLISKTDFSDSQQLENWLQAHNEQAICEKLPLPNERITEILFSSTFIHKNKVHNCSKTVHQHAKNIQTIAIQYPDMITEKSLFAFLNWLQNRYANQLLRFKGLIYSREKPQTPLLIQGVRHILYTQEYLASWSKLPPQTQLVIIGINLNQINIQDMFQAFLNRPIKNSTADYTENPLAISGFEF